MNNSKLKIGVATHSFGFNYGGTLQCFALLKTLNEGGYDAEFIDYCAVGGRGRAPAHIKFAHRLASSVVPTAKAYSRRMGIFERFREANCPKTPRFQTYSQVRDYAKAYDACVVGSDQVWNPVFQGTSQFYMLKFVPPHRRVAYAASFGAAKLPDSLLWVYEKRLRDFLAISTREASGAAIVESLGLPRPAVALDPTMLATADKWRSWLDAKPEDREKYERNARRFSAPYVLCYGLKGLGETRACVELARKTAAKFDGARILLVASDHLSSVLRKNFPDVTVVDDVDPFEFVDLIARAAFVVTNSFHGSVFSILFHKKFYALLSEGQNPEQSTNSRLVDLFKALGLTARFKHMSDEVEVESIPDYASVDAKLAELRARSLEYLMSSLQKTQTVKKPTLCEQDKCCGCAACANKCPTGALTMALDDVGFWRPQIDYGKCVECRLCEQACPILNPREKRTPEPKVYAAWNNQTDVRRDCSSGGMFPLFAERALQEGGAVYGVAYDERFIPRFKRVDDARDLPALRSSKYAEAEVGSILRDVLADLKAGRTVVFAGTPCQVAGLRGYLGREYDNLLTFDLCCHGAPSALFLRKRLDALEKEKGEKIVGVRFRGKKLGWTRGLAPGNVSVIYASGETSDFKREDIFYTLAFTGNLSLRQSCGTCPFATVPRQGDVTLADFWGLGYAKPFEYPKNDGVSLVLVNSPQGEAGLEKIRGEATLIERPLAEAKNGNKVLVRPSRLHPKRKFFVFDSMTLSYEELEKKWRRVVFVELPLWKKAAVRCKRFVYRVAKLH